MMEAEGKASRYAVTVAIVTSIGLGALNSIFSKIKSDELQIFDGMVSGTMNALGYCALYWPMLWWRHHRGTVTTEELVFMFWDDGTGRDGRGIKGAHRLIVAGGLADEGGQILSAVAQPYVSIVASSLLGQTSSLWTLGTSALFLGSRYVFEEFAGVGVALAGASLEVVAIQSGGDAATQPSMAFLILLSAVAPAFSFVLKEKCFRLWKATRSSSDKRPRGSNDPADPLLSPDKERELDVWVVASAAGLWSLIWAPFVCVATAYIKKPHSMALATYASQSFRCFANRLDYADAYVDDDDTSDARKACTHAWQWWTLYMVTNVLYNVSIYRVVRLASALTSFVAGKLVTPAAIFLALLPWPVIGAGTIQPIQAISLAIIMAGVAIFRHGTAVNRRVFPPGSPEACCWPLARRSMVARPHPAGGGGAASGGGGATEAHTISFQPLSSSSSEDSSSLI